MAACFRLVSLLEIQQEQEQEQEHQEKGCLMVMADPTDLGHGKKSVVLAYFTGCMCCTVR